MMNVYVCHHFHPVGQGLFASGVLTLSGIRQACFRWVYDCGTSSSQRLINDALRKFSNEYQQRRLDLAVISHFDADHISGMVCLLNKVGTDKLMLPWAPLWHRLVIGFAQDLEENDPVFGFYIDPVRYLTDEAEDGFNQLVFVPFSDGEGPPDPEGIDDPSPEPEDGIRMKIEYYDKEPKPDDLAEWSTYFSESSHKSKIKMMRKGSAVFVSGIWEFVPYNDPATRPRNEAAFVQRVNELRSSLLTRSDEDRKNALHDLKSYYLQCFQKSQLNDLSLFFYGGPIGGWRCRQLFDPFDDQVSGSILYTGDGNLSTLRKWVALSGYLGPRRALRPSIFQVPHHGSKNSWITGLGSKIKPRISVLSSDPSRKSFGHPHCEVLRDLWPFTPVRVDKLECFRAKVVLYQ